jgi:DNA invertase Pin-like site-specific DNA recombinase
MNEPTNSKVTADHLKRPAYLYVRQSTMRQVAEHTESTQRQYALGQQAAALGWPRERIVTIDDDLGVSAASQGREGFARLVAEVGMGQAGIVMGLEVSRLARNSSDWHRLLEICALTSTLILDEDGLYDPAHFNDRLLLGLKGTMSEAELHVLRARMFGGMLSKARRGELKMRLPAGLVYDSADQVILDPDQQVQQSLRQLFCTFRRVGTVHATVRAFAAEGLQFPRHVHGGPHHGDLVWSPLTQSRATETLHNPRYAGAYVYGRRTQRRRDTSGQPRSVTLPQEEWTVLIKEAHEGYLTWEQYEENLRRLRANAGNGGRTWKNPPREGLALLQGMVVCGACGRAMSVRYHHRRGQLWPQYVCKGPGFQRAEPPCDSIPGQAIDQAISQLLVETMSPLSLEISLAVQQEIQERIDEADQLRRKHVDRARYEMELARRRYLRVDPDNRLVADSLETEWNGKLKELASAEEEYQRRRQADRELLDEKARARIRALSTDFPRLWNDSRTPQRERKRMARLLLQDVTLLRDNGLTVHVRFKGGANRTMKLPRPPRCWELRQTDPEVLEQIDQLMNEHTFDEIAVSLERQGVLSGCGNSFDGYRVRRLARYHGLPSRFDRLRARGLLTLAEMAQRLNVCTSTVKRRRAQGLLQCEKLDDAGQYLYVDPDQDPSSKSVTVPARAKEVQYG